MHNGHIDKPNSPIAGNRTKGPGSLPESPLIGPRPIIVVAVTAIPIITLAMTRLITTGAIGHLTRRLANVARRRYRARVRTVGRDKSILL